MCCAFVAGGLRESTSRNGGDSSGDIVSRIYDVFTTLMTLANIAATVLVPKGDLMLPEGDRVILYTQEKFAHASTITLCPSNRARYKRARFFLRNGELRHQPVTSHTHS